MSEDRYFHMQFIIKETPDITLDSMWNWIEELLPECDGDDINECHCGIESMGGGSGTLDQCFRSIGIADDIEEVNPADVRIVLDYIDTCMVLPEVREAAARLRDQIDWWPNTLAAFEEGDDDVDS